MKNIHCLANVKFKDQRIVSLSFR